nr:carbohydrate binding domain-containing protein [uncultured Ruminococcus sp.]
MSYAENVALNRTATHDNTCSPIWIYNFANGGDASTGADITNAFRLAQRIGVSSLKTSPNTTVNAKWTTTKEAFTEAPKYRVNNYNLFYLDTYNNKITNPKSEVIAPIKAALNNNELVTYTTYVFSWKNKTIQKDSRVPENTKYANDDIAIYSTGYSGCHRMTIVGYDDDIWVDINGDGKIQEAEKGAFKIVNSWGTNYGNNGFAWVSYDALNYESAVSDSLPNRLNQPTIFDLMRVSVKPIDACSNINLEYTLNTKYRDEVSIALTAKNINTGKTYEGNVEPFQSYKKEYGNYRCSFDGTKNYSTGDFAYDLSNIVQNLNSNNVSDYTWTLKFTDDTSDDSTLSVSDVKIVDNNNNKTYKSDLNGTVKLNGNSKDITVNGGGTTPDKNAVTIYYKGYSSPYIHYQVGDGNWTTVPGKAMIPDTTVDGYTHTYTIDLGTSTYANVCFNNGNGSWDSRNGQNYHFEKGTYTFSNGNMTKIAD